MISESIAIDCPADKIWNILIKIEDYSNWHPNVSFISEQFVLGKSTELTMNMGTRQIKTVVRISQLEKNSQLEWQGSLFKSPILQKFFSITHCFRLQTLDENKTLFINEESFSGIIGVVVGFLMQAKLKIRYRQVNEALKAECEKFNGYYAKNNVHERHKKSRKC